jgi:hypothetical protein
MRQGGLGDLARKARLIARPLVEGGAKPWTVKRPAPSLRIVMTSDDGVSG